MKYRVVVKHSTLPKDLQTFGHTIEYIDEWLTCSESKIPDGATVQVFEVVEKLIRTGVVGTIGEDEGSRLEAAGLLLPKVPVKSKGAAMTDVDRNVNRKKGEPKK